MARAGLPPAEASERVVRDVLTKVATVTGAGLDLAGGVRAWSDADRVVIGPSPQARRLPDVALTVPGTTVSPAWGLEVVVEQVEAATRPAGRLEAVVDSAVCRDGLVMRQRRPGDRFVPLGGPGHVKVQDLLVDRKVPREERDRVPVIVSGGEIVWLPGHRIAQRWAVGSPSSGAVRLCVLPSAAVPVGVLRLASEGP
jgi:tRNA(Ile)-lysidine synthase